MGNGNAFNRWDPTRAKRWNLKVARLTPVGKQYGEIARLPQKSVNEASLPHRPIRILSAKAPDSISAVDHFPATADHH